MDNPVTDSQPTPRPATMRSIFPAVSWLVPNVVVVVGAEWLTWEPRAGFHEVGPDASLLRGFLALAGKRSDHALANAVQSYAATWGVLTRCRCLDCGGYQAVDPRGHREWLPDWRRRAEEIAAVVKLSAQVRAGALGDERDWQTVRPGRLHSRFFDAADGPDGSWAPPDDWLPPQPEMTADQKRRLLAARRALTEAPDSDAARAALDAATPSARQPDAFSYEWRPVADELPTARTQGDWLAAFVSRAMAEAYVRPALAYGPGGFDLRFNVGGLTGGLWFAACFAVSGRRGLAICAEGHAFVPRKWPGAGVVRCPRHAATERKRRQRSRVPKPNGGAE